MRSVTIVVICEVSFEDLKKSWWKDGLMDMDGDHQKEGKERRLVYEDDDQWNHDMIIFILLLVFKSEESIAVVV